MMALEVKAEDTLAIGVARKDAPPAKVQQSNAPDPLSESALVAYFSAMKQMADEHRRPREAIWDAAWGIYNNEYDWSEKAWWQHKVPVSKVRPSVDRAVALFRKALLKLAPFYGIQAESSLGKTKGRYTMLLTDYWFDQSNIIEELVMAFRIGLITSVSALKIWWTATRDFKPEVTINSIEEPVMEFGVQVGSTTREEKQINLKQHARGKLGIKAINPKFLWVIPNTNGRGIIEKDQATLNSIEQMADEGIYDKEAVKKLREKITTGGVRADENQWTSHGGAAPSSDLEKPANPNDYLRLIDLYHFWYDIYDTDGRLVMADASFTLANEDTLIRKARPNPFFHKDPPYVIGTPYQLPFSTYGRGMVEDVVEIAKSITNMSNLVADGALYDALKAFAIDVKQLSDPNEARSGLYPGKVFSKDSDLSPGQPLIETIDVGKVPAEAMNMIGLFEKFYQEGSFMNEFVSGQGPASGETLGEVNIKTQAALEGLDESARNLEVTVIEPTVSMASKVIYQYHNNYMLPRLVEAFMSVSVLLQQLSPAERYAIMIGDYNFKVRGLSIMVEMAQKMGEFKEFLTLMSYLPGFLERINIDAALEEIFLPLGWDPRRLLLQPGEGGVTMPLGQNAGGQGIPTGQKTPMQQRNADQGASQGGSANNPNARRTR